MGDLIFIGSIFCALMSAYLLFFKKNIVHLFSDRILAFLFLAYSYCTIGFLLISSGWISYFPNLYRTSAPVNYLVPPLAYLYVRSVIKNENNWKWKDAFHLIPFIFISINYIPLYVMRIEDKKNIVKLVVENYNNNYNIQDGFFSEKIQFLRPIQSIIYIVLQWRLIYSFEKNKYESYFKEHTNLILSWLKKFTFAITFTILTFLIFVIGVIYTMYSNHNINDIVFYASIPVAISLFYLSSYLILNPTIFLGLPYIDYNKNNIPIEVLDKSKYEQEIAAIESYFVKNKPYLKQGYSINEFSLAVSLPAKLVSFLINNHFHKNFNDFVNAYRIAYVEDCINAGELNNYTLYALATRAGFSNKTSFVNAFKKVHNFAPSQYVASKLAP
jgi:AraC-like DNA-binding protein